MARKPQKTKTITSRSLTLSTNKFCLDFTWRKVEIEEDASPLRQPPIRNIDASRENFAAVLERKQITSLVAPTHEDISPYRTLPISLAPLSQPSGSQVVRKYGYSREPASDPDKDDYV